MNTNDILQALMFNEIYLSEVEQACEIFRNFNIVRSNLVAAGVAIEITFNSSNALITSKHINIANEYGLDKSKVANFFRDNPKVQESHSPFYNKFQLIKTFRETFRTGLAQTKAIIESVYG